MAFSSSLEANSASIKRVHSDDPLTSTRRGPKQFSAREYANAVHRHANVSSTENIAPGSNYTDLADFLLEPYLPHSKASNLDASHVPKQARCPQEVPLMTYYNFKDPLCGDRQKHYYNVQELDDCDVTTVRGTGSYNLVFLRGYTSPEWLNAVGAKFLIDPEFFRQHLDFRTTKKVPRDYSNTLLPSVTSNMCRLTLTTIVSCMDRFRGVAQPAQSELQALRLESGKNFENYLETLRRAKSSDIACGDSIVRRFHVLDHEHFLIEQDVSVYFEEWETGALAVVWTDVARDLEQGPKGPWNSGSFCTSRWVLNYLPTFQQKSFAALKTYHDTQKAKARDSHNPKIPQNASFIHVDYGRKLDCEVMAFDPFSIVEGVYRFAAFSEAQSLNAVEVSLGVELEPKALLKQKNPTIENFLYTRRLLIRHLARLKNNVAFLTRQRESTSSPPRSYEPSRHKSEPTLPSLLKDYSNLLSRSEELTKECDHGMNIVMNNAMIKEARDAMSQAEGIAKLTMCAYFFMPLSLTSSFFGMNFSELVPGSLLKIWVWFAASVPILILSFVILSFDIPLRFSFVSKRMWFRRKHLLGSPSEVDYKEIDV